MKKTALIFISLFVGAQLALAGEDDILKRNPDYSTRLNKEADKILALNLKFRLPDAAKECAKAEALSDCYLKQLHAMHSKEELSASAFSLAFPTVIYLVSLEKDQFRKSKTKISNSQVSHFAHKKQATVAVKILEMMCTHATAKDWGVKEAEMLKADEKSASTHQANFEKTAKEEIEQTRKYSELDGAALKVDFEQAIACRKK